MAKKKNASNQPQPQKPSKTVDIYTDGSFFPEHQLGGWAAILVFQSVVSKRIRGYARSGTHNRFEILPAVIAMERLTEPCIVNLYSDSQHLINLILSGKILMWKNQSWQGISKGDAENRDLFERLAKQLEKHTVHAVWIKGHSGHPFNTECDQLAKKTAKAVINAPF